MRALRTESTNHSRASRAKRRGGDQDKGNKRPKLKSKNSSGRRQSRISALGTRSSLNRSLAEQDGSRMARAMPRAMPRAGGQWIEAGADPYDAGAGAVVGDGISFSADVLFGGAVGGPLEPAIQQPMWMRSGRSHPLSRPTIVNDGSSSGLPLEAEWRRAAIRRDGGLAAAGQRARALHPHYGGCPYCGCPTGMSYEEYTESLANRRWW